jgi:glucose/mannose-6-phosphate isomerase
MLGLAADLGRQLRAGFELGRRTDRLPSGEGIRSILMCGMGGSGIAGDMIRSLFERRLTVPVVVTKGYEVPEFCGRDTLVVASSFSGNTEETLAAFEEAVTRGCRLVGVSAGGTLAARSDEEAVAHVRLPSDVAMPRAALGYLFAAAIGVLDAMDIVPHPGDDLERTAELLDGLAQALGPEIPAEANQAKSVALWLLGRTPLVWGSEGLAQAPALRWKTQLNENAKVPAFASVLPELDHNEIEGWSPGAGNGYGVVLLRYEGEHPRVARRVHATLESIASAGLDAREVRAVGTSPMEWLFSLVMLGDFTSIYLGVERGVDPWPIPVLMGLKERLRR